MPVVSCIMPTSRRRDLVPHAIDYFLRQDFESRELIIVDDGPDPIRDLLPDDDRIRYLRLDGVNTIGAKRNAACELATGEFIAHWDDDDWMAPWRLTYQIDSLRETGGDMCGLSSLVFLDARASKAWRYEYPATARPWVAGATMCYRRDHWKRRPFDSISHGEDTRFVWHAQANVVALQRRDFYVAMLHARNTSSRIRMTRRWHPCRLAEVEAILGADCHRYLQAAHTRPTRDEPHVTVSIPYFRCPKYVRRSVESILAQSHVNLTLVVVNDADPDSPWRHLAHIDDPRLVRFDLPTNQGCYFANNLVLQACDSEYIMLQDADDWSEPDRLEQLLRALRRHKAVCASSSQATHQDQRATRVRRYPSPNRRLTARLEHRVPYTSLYRTDALRSIGGFFAGERYAYDTLLINALIMIGRIASVDRPLYHRRIRPGSLTTSTGTGFGSQSRKDTHQRLCRMYQSWRAEHVRARNHASMADVIRADVDRRMSMLERSLLDEQTDRLRSLLGTTRKPNRREALHDPHLTPNPWAIDSAMAEPLMARLRRRPPRHMLEAGSGVSTVLFAELAADHGTKVTTLEHDPDWYERTRRALADRDLLQHVDLRLVGLRPVAGSRWYDLPPGEDIDFVFIDGPPQRIGRAAAIPAIQSRLSDDWELWLKDGLRDHERSCVRDWLAMVDCEAELMNVGRGFWILRALPKRQPSTDMMGLATASRVS